MCKFGSAGCGFEKESVEEWHVAREDPAHPGLIVGNWVRMESEDRVTEAFAVWSSVFKWPSWTGRSRGASCVRNCWRAIWGCDREPPHGVSATLVSQTLALLGCRRVLILFSKLLCGGLVHLFLFSSSCAHVSYWTL